MQSLLDKINRHPRATFLVAGITVFSVSAAIILAMMLSLRNTIVNPVITPEDEKKVLSEVIKNNPKEIINPAKVTPVGPVVAPVESLAPVNPAPQPQPTPQQPAIIPNPTLPSPTVAPDLNVYNYRVTRTTFTKGPSFDVCNPYSGARGGYGMGMGAGPGPGYLTDGTTTVTEYYEYFERYLSFFKYVSREDGNLSGYSINKYGRNINTSTHYLNGEYAVENVFNPYPEYDSQRDEETVSYPVYTQDELVKYYFGSNAQIVEVQTDASGNKFYIIQSSYQTYCEPGYDPYLVLPEPQVVQPRMLISIYKVNGKTFNIDEVKRYIDSISNLNLLDTTITSSSRQKVTQNQIANEFSLGSSVNVKKFDYTNQTYVYNPYEIIKEQVSYLSNSNVDAIVISQPKDLLSYLYVPNFKSSNIVNSMQFYQDRAFYPADNWGTKLYNRYNRSFDTDLVYSLSLTDRDGYYYSISRYNDSTSLVKLKSDLLDLKTTTSSSELVDININDIVVSAERILRSQTRNYPVSYVSYPTSYSVNTYTSYYVNYLFEYNGAVYNVSISSGKDTDPLSNKVYKTLPLVTQEDIENAKKDLVEMHLNYQYTYYYNPVSYPGLPVSYMN